MKKLKILVLSLYLLITSGFLSIADDNWPEYGQNPFIIKLDHSQHNMSGRGGVIVSDLNSDSLLDFVLSTKTNDNGEGIGTIGAYDHSGNIMWAKADIDININGKAENYGLPGWGGPGISTDDVDGDGRNEVIYLNTQNEIVVRDGVNGNIIKEIKINLPVEGFISRVKNSVDILFHGSKEKALNYYHSKPKRWSHFQIVNLNGEGSEIVLQADPLPFRWLRSVSLTTGKTLWENHQYIGLKHGGFRAADIDGDGFDEIVGGLMIDNDGTIINQWKFRKFPGHLDSLFIGDILPEEPGIEWVLLEESHNGDDRTVLLGKDKIFFYHSFNGWEPQNAAIGEFDLERPGLEIWCRSRFNKDQRPWVIDSSGKTVGAYRLNDRKPANWSDEGVECINTIDWDGSPKKLLAAKERHVDGKICLMDPISGEFIKWWGENAARIYIVDVAGDYREEIVVINSKQNEIRIYWNHEKCMGEREERYWSRNDYKRQKLNYNYYSP